MSDQTIHEKYDEFKRAIERNALKDSGLLPIEIDSGRPLNKLELRILREMIAERVGQRGGTG